MKIHPDPDNAFQYWEVIDLISKLGKNKTEVQNIMDKMWEKYGKIFEIRRHDRMQMIIEDLEKEKESTDLQCFPNESCWSTVEKNLRSIYALYEIPSTFPVNPGLYLAYHFNRIFTQDSYLGYNAKEWETVFEKEPDGLISILNKYLSDFTYHLSNEKLKNVSILDLPGFGSTFNGHCEFIPWSIQFNMAIYSRLMTVSHEYESEYEYGYDYNFINFWEVASECINLQSLWKNYLRDPETNFYPPEIENNTYFNHSNIIKEDMATFLAVYAASIKISSNENSRIWMNAANKTFNEIEGKERKKTTRIA